MANMKAKSPDAQGLNAGATVAAIAFSEDLGELMSMPAMSPAPISMPAMAPDETAADGMALGWAIMFVDNQSTYAQAISVSSTSAAPTTTRSRFSSASSAASAWRINGLYHPGRDAVRRTGRS